MVTQKDYLLGNQRQKSLSKPFSKKILKQILKQIFKAKHLANQKQIFKADSKSKPFSKFEANLLAKLIEQKRNQKS